MDKAAILARLQEHEPALRERGVTHAAIFGSRARGDARPGSDTDIMIEIAGQEQKVEAFIDLMRPYGIIQLARTGRIALVRGRGKGAESSGGTT